MLPDGFVHLRRCEIRLRDALSHGSIYVLRESHDPKYNLLARNFHFCQSHLASRERYILPEYETEIVEGCGSPVTSTFHHSTMLLIQIFFANSSEKVLNNTNHYPARISRTLTLDLTY